MRDEIIKPRLAADRLGFESIPYLLTGDFFVNVGGRAEAGLARRELVQPCACNDCHG
jgi:hypothetical protein